MRHKTRNVGDGNFINAISQDDDEYGVDDMILGVPKKVPLSHKKVSILKKRSSYLGTAQKDKPLLRTFLGDKGPIFGTP